MGRFCSLHWSINIISLVKLYSDSLKYSKRKLWLLSIISFFSCPLLVVPEAICYLRVWGAVPQRSMSLGLLKPSESQVGCLTSVVPVTAQGTETERPTTTLAAVPSAWIWTLSLVTLEKISFAIKASVMFAWGRSAEHMKIVRKAEVMQFYFFSLFFFLVTCLVPVPSWFFWAQLSFRFSNPKFSKRLCKKKKKKWKTANDTKPRKK